MQPSCLNSLLESQAKQHPDAIAITAPGRIPLKYHQLNQHIHQLVATLHIYGIGRHDRVAIVLPNGPEMAVAFLAVTTTATSAPLNLAYRAEEFDFYLSDLNAKALIIQAGIAEPARTVAKTRGILIIELQPVLEAEAGIVTLIPTSTNSELNRSKNTSLVQPDDIALVLHTSGTTSRPKIVPLTQNNLCSSAHSISSILELSEYDRCLNMMPLFHIHGLIGALLASLSVGACIVCSLGFNASQFFQWLKVFSPTWYTAVPTMHQAILAHASNHHEIINDCQLRFIRSSSAALPPQVLTDLEKVFHAPVIEAYGMTEASHQMASNPLPPRQRKLGSVGIAAGPEIAIMDEVGHLLPRETLGEIVIRGTNVTSGYENNSSANQSAFTNGWFRTGDQGYLDSDNYLFITGRLKEIINRGGEKIAPREVDEALLEHPDILQAVAFAIPHPTLGEDLAAAVVLRNQASLTGQMIREFAFQQLADFKVPSEVVIVDEIPKGATGKLQRLGLADQLAKQLQRDYVAPRNDLEMLIADIWAEILEINSLGVHDNFFRLGGDSLRATRVISQLQAFFSIDLPIVTLFMKPTVAELAQVLATSIDANELSAIAKLVAELDELSDEEAKRLLDQELGRN
jgi:acyl-CoA synthetase (AMP-forming)/AMP-acid ligase II/acyl carrier protein